VTDPGCDTDDDDCDDEQDDEEKSETKQCHVLGRKRQEVVEIRPLYRINDAWSLVNITATEGVVVTFSWENFDFQPLKCR